MFRGCKELWTLNMMNAGTIFNTKFCSSTAVGFSACLISGLIDKNMSKAQCVSTINICKYQSTRLPSVYNS